MTTPSNHLQDETSAYLLQHAHNPVDWYPWNEASLALARELDKPILLSIGYSACHWCHVMAHESFEDSVTAALMNELFVSIKVDKEERPDLDKIYQTAHQIINQKPGGWPLTVALDPQTLLPFFVGTYFPNEERLNLPAFKDVLEQVANFYYQEKEHLQDHQRKLQDIFTQLSEDNPVTEHPLSSNPLAIATQQLAQLFDKRHGGFGSKPKFPQPSNLERLLRYSFYDVTEREHCQDMLFTTLNHMALGGIYDHLGGGFFRYSVDALWTIPHFEKMLYDNAQLLAIYSDALAIKPNPLYQHHILQTAEWAMREMRASAGGFYATLDADTEHLEGKFYVWDKAEIKQYLTPEEYEIFAEIFGLNKPPNFEHYWHLHVVDADHYPPEGLLAIACQKLRKIRALRVHPGRDEKIITAWNGLMIKGLAKAGLATQQQSFIDAASQTVDFIHDHLFLADRLYATYQAGQARFIAYLDDYAFLLDGILYLLEARWSSQHLQFAIQLAESLIKNYWDDKNGGLFFTAHDQDALIYRPKPLTDEALPSGNGIAAGALLRLGYLLGETRYLDIAHKTLLAAESSINHLPYAHNTLLNVLEDYLQPPKNIIIRGAGDELHQWQQACLKHFNPQRHVYAIPDDAKDLPAALAEKVSSEKTVAYVCQGMQCLPAVRELGELERI